MFEDGIDGFGDMAYDIVPHGMAGWGDISGFGSYGDMAYDIVPAPDQFGLEGYGALDDFDDDLDYDLDGYGVVATAKNLARLRAKRYRLKQKLKYRKRKTGPWSRRSAKKKIRALTRKINRLYAKVRKQRKKGKSGKRIQRLRRIAPRATKIRRERVRRYRKVGKVTRSPYAPIKPEVQEYESATEPEEDYEALEPETEEYQPIQSRVEKYEDADEEDEPPMASEPRARRSSVVRIRRTAPASNLQLETEFDMDDEDDDMDDDIEDTEDEDMDGFGAYDDGYGTVATAKNLARLRARRYKLKQKLKYRTKKKGPWSRKSLRRRIAKLTRRINKIKAKSRRQMRRRRAAGKKLLFRHKRISRIMKARPGSKRTAIAVAAASAGMTPKYRLKAKLRRRMMRKGWKRPPASFMPRARPLTRWKMWNKSRMARRRFWARFRRRRGGRRFPGYRPIPRPVPRYRTLKPPVQAYRVPPMPGPSFAPIAPPVGPYRPAPMPRVRRYRPVGRTAYTYTTAQAQQQAARAAYADKATQVAEAAAERSTEAAEEAESEEAGSSGTMKIAIALAVVGGTVWFIKKNKKKGAKKKGATTAKKTTSTSAFA